MGVAILDIDRTLVDTEAELRDAGGREVCESAGELSERLERWTS
jgi:hypothetical protein